jgi:hypothetical protein
LIVGGSAAILALRRVMGRLRGWFLILYLAAAAGYGGWRGAELWSGWGVWCVLLPPLAWGILRAAGEWRRNRNRVSLSLGLLLTVFAVVAVGGQALVLAWIVAETAGRWSSQPAMRSAVAAGMFFAAGGLALIAYRSAQPGKPPDQSNTRNGTGAFDAATDRGGRSERASH